MNMLGRTPKLGALALPAAILVLIILMIVPVPAIVLDVCFVMNIALSVAVLMAAMNAEKPVDFSSFPSVLLFATLLRLSLNVASTRVVLMHGHEGEEAAGKVIESFGAFLIGGNFAVGLFVFMILVIINMVVVTKGAGRVSEVSARFTLDALPGKQMAIDADLAAGLVTADEAKTRRREVATEADFYGAMDGSSKFVKGDAVAALLILGVNLIAGFCLGMISHGFSASEAAHRYIALAVGDALVAQIPSLLLSIAAAVIVTRVSDSRDLAGQIGGQLGRPGTWLPVGIVLAAIGCIPAMPQTIFLPAAGLVFWLWNTLRKRAARPAPVNEPAAAEPADPGRIVLADVSDHTLVTIELGYGLVQLLDERRGAPLVGRITGVRKQLSQLFGFILPQFRLRDALDVAPNDYRIQLGGVPLGGATIRADRILAIDAGEARPGHGVQGEATIDPSFGCAALWIDPAQRDLAIAEGFLTVDASTVIATHLNQLLSARPQELLGPDEVKALVDGVKEHSAGLIETIFPAPLTLAGLTRLLRTLLEDGIPIAHPLPIFSSLSRAVQVTQDFDRLVDMLRTDLGAMIVGRVCPPSQRLPVITLDASLEAMILGGMQDPSTGQPLIEPDLARTIGERVSRLLADRGSAAAALTLVVQPRAPRPVGAAQAARAGLPGPVDLRTARSPADRGRRRRRRRERRRSPVSARASRTCSNREPCRMKHDHAAFLTPDTLAPLPAALPRAVSRAYAGDAADRVRRFLPLVKRLAWHVHGSGQSGGRAGIELEDLMQAGLVALTEAAQRHAGPGEDGFAAYAKLRVRGAMVDLVRRAVPLSRSASEAPRFESLDEVYADTNAAFADERPDSLTLLTDEQTRDAVIAAIAALSERLQMIVQLYFVEELNLSEIAEVLGVSIPRVHQLKAQALGQLKASLAGMVEIV